MSSALIYSTNHIRQFSNSAIEADIFCDLNHQVIQKIRDYARDQLHNDPNLKFQEDLNSSITINIPESLIQDFIEPILKSAAHHSKNDQVVKCTSFIKKLYPFEKIRVFKSETANSYFSCGFRWEKETKNSLYRVFLRTNGIRTVLVKQDQSHLSCYQWAFLQKGIEYEKGQLYFPSKAPQILNELGFEEVFDPQPGDLVLFSNQRDFTHVGIYEEGNIVRSKHGIDADFISYEKLEDVPTIYGSNVQFFRKTQS